jgi:hypothetical protein
LFIDDVTTIQLGQRLHSWTVRLNEMLPELEKKEKEFEGIKTLYESYKSTPSFGDVASTNEV